MTVAEWLSVSLLTLLFAGSGAAELPLHKRFVDDYVRWGYPRSWSIITPATKLLAGALVVVPQTRLIGAALCVLVSIAALGSVLRVAHRSRYIPASVVLVFTLACVAILLPSISKRVG